MKNNNQWKKVFCLEGLWDLDLRKKASVEPVMELLSKYYSGFDYIHRSCITTKEAEYYIEKWSQKRYKDYPILYLAFHGEEGELKLTNRNISLNALSDMLENKCQNKVIIVSSCNTLKVEDHVVKKFLEKTGALCIIGYQSEADWVRSAAHDLLLLEILQEYEFSGRGMKGIRRKIEELSQQFTDLKVVSY